MMNPVNLNRPPLSDEELDTITSGGNEAYFVKCDSETTTQNDTASTSMPGMHKVANVTLKRG